MTNNAKRKSHGQGAFENAKLELFGRKMAKWKLCCINWHQTLRYT